MFEAVFDFIFPKRCIGCKKFGSYICDNDLAHIEIYEDFACPMCLRHSTNGKTHPSCVTKYGLDGLVAGVVYKGIAKRLLSSLRYKPYMVDLRTTIGTLFFEMMLQNELFMAALPQQPIVMPIPLSSKQLKKRGFNQAELLSSYLAKQFKLRENNQILRRIKHTNPQFTLNKLQRFHNVAGVFDLDKKFSKDIKGKTVFLVDDLATSCATLREGAVVLKRNGAKQVYGVVFAREL